MLSSDKKMCAHVSEYAFTEMEYKLHRFLVLYEKKVLFSISNFEQIDNI